MRKSILEVWHFLCLLELIIAIKHILVVSTKTKFFLLISAVYGWRVQVRIEIKFLRKRLQLLKLLLS